MIWGFEQQSYNVKGIEPTRIIINEYIKLYLLIQAYRISDPVVIMAL